MEKWESYFHQPKPIEDLIKSAIIVVDTNVLLSAYQWRDLTVREMIKTLENIADEDRLYIPLQVIKEFSKNRPKEIVQRINEIEGILSTLQPQKPLNQIVPILEGRENYQVTLTSLTSYNEIQIEYRKGLRNLRDDLRELFIHDPYLEELKQIISKSYFQPTNSDNEDELIKTAEKRFKEKTPPGYKDDGKEENNAGDYIVWDSILSLNSDVVFISGDKKPDWVYRDKQKNSISARRELVEEFYLATGGKDFLHVSPKEFITLLNPDVSEEIKTDLSENIISFKEYNDEIDIGNVYLRIHKILLDYMHLGIVLEDKKIHYYDVAKEIILLFQESSNENHFIDQLKDLMFHYYGIDTMENKNSDKMFSEILEELLFIN